ncbi:MAG: hypothetical protein IBX55_21205 [Methyloprofundus sp.]|nr:hypothetical protein [Methyloprofundus sp.]
MKYLPHISTLLLIGIAGSASANCSNDGYTTAGVPTDISGKQIIATGGGYDWKEDHCASGDLYKLGNGTTIDPYAFRGKWSISDNTVTYNYTVGGNSTYIWNLWKDVRGNLCWDDGINIIATAPAPADAGACVTP